MNFKLTKWRFTTDRLYTSIVLAYPMWFVIAEEMPLSLSSEVEDKLESYDLTQKENKVE